MAVIAGRTLDARRHLRLRITGMVLVLMIVSFGLIYLGGHRFGWMVAGVLLMDACMQALNMTNQSVIYDLLARARSRLTTVYMTMLFVGGALGSVIGAQAYGRWGWAGSSAVSVAFSLLGLLA